MATKKKTNSNYHEVATGWSQDFYCAQMIAERNYQLALQRDPSLNQQVIKFDIRPINTAKFVGYLAKYYFVGINNSPVVENHPKLEQA